MIPKVKSILFATDLTEDSRRAFQYAAGMSAVYGAVITILHVIEKVPAGVRQHFTLREGEEMLDKVRKAHQQKARETLIGKRKEDDLMRKTMAEFYGWTASPGHAEPGIEVVLDRGDVAAEILKMSETQGCDFILMGAHKGRWGSTALGSVTKKVLHKSRVPVVIIPPQESS